MRHLSKEDADAYQPPDIVRRCQATVLDILTWWSDFSRTHEFKYYAYAGTLLGMVRHADIIPWDDDADLCITEDSMERLLKSTLRPDIIIRLSPRQACYRLYKKGHDGFVDLMPIKVFDGEIVNYSLQPARDMFPKEWAYYSEIHPLQTLHFGKISLSAPRCPEKCLTRMYGDDWRCQYIMHELHDQCALCATALALYERGVACNSDHRQ